MSDVPKNASGDWATGAVLFAGVMMMVIGFFQLVQGIAAILEDTIFVTTPNFFLEFDVTAWGWIHAAVGLLLILGGYALVSGKTWGRVLAIVLAILTACANFLFIPYYPWWSLLIIALCIWVIWAVTSRWDEMYE